MNKLLSFFQPSPEISEINDPETVKADYKYWRIRILYSMFIGYSCYYFTRRSFTFAMPGLIQELGFDKTDLGILASVLSISYGMSKFASGIIVDRTSPRYMMAFGLFMTGVFNICFGLSSSILFFAIFWGLNGLFQGFGAPPCAVFLTRWYSHSERGGWWSTWSVSHNVGGFLIPWVVGFSLKYFGWRYGMYIPGVFCIIMGFFLINRLRNSPESLGLPPIEKFRQDNGGIVVKESSSGDSATRILIDYVFKNPYIWLLAISYFFVYAVREGINHWTALFLVESKGYSNILANGCVSLFEVGGFCGSLTAGWSSDKFFGGKRGPVNVIFAAAMFLTIGIFWSVPAGYAMMDSIFMFLVGFSIFGPQMMIGLTAAELTHKKAVGSANGFLGFIAYGGAACAGLPLGYITHSWGWDAYYIALLSCCVISTFLLLPLWAVTGADVRRRQQPSQPSESLLEAN